MRSLSRRLRRVLGLVLLLTLLAGGIVWAFASPSNERRWVPEHARMPAARFADNLVHVSDVRDFTHAAPGSFTARYDDRTYDLNRLTSVWFLVVPFYESWRGPAHSFVSFGFADSQFVAISVEARREPGESYDPITGAFRRFELLYVVGDERDLIGQRARFLRSPVYLYPIRATPEQIRAMFVGMLQRANHLREHPEFYNTLTNNCTSNVIDHVNQIEPNTVPTGLKTILPGYSDEVAQSLGLIDSDLDVERARERFRINERARRYAGDPRFSWLIRGER